jgi:hypothetical protein
MVPEIKDVRGTRRVGSWLCGNYIKINVGADLLRCDKAELNEPVQDRAQYVNSAVNFRVS